ncbi:Asp23/Gls24 family envelope stress response protein [Kribbella sp. WER1]
MTEPSSVAYGGDRGRLEIAQRAVERIAEITARRHGGVVRRDGVLGRGLPKARAVVAGRRTRIELQVAAAWGRPLAEVAAEVQQAVTEDVERFTGLGVDRVDVDITAVEARPAEDHAPAVRGAEEQGAGARGAARPRAAVGERGVSSAFSAVAARGPVAGAGVWGFGVVGALVLVGVGVVGVAEMLRATGLLRGQVIPADWFGRTVVVEPGDWMRVAGIAAVVVGLVVLVLAVKPRRRTHLQVGDLVWIRPAAAARLAADSASRVDSVTAASVVAKRRRLQATVTMFGSPKRVHDEVQATIADRLRSVTPQPRVRVDLREE